MTEQWHYQLRISLADAFAETARRDPDDPQLAPLPAILARHDAALKCQYDAFAAYVAEAERRGTHRFPLYAWTRDTIENPAKKAKYVKSFALHVAGDGVYSKEKASRLEADLRPLVGGPLVTVMSLHDTNPESNPQPPKRYRS